MANVETVSSWVENGAIAVVIGAMFFMACFLPGLLWQYRRYGGFSFPRMLGLAAVCLYGTALLAYTFLPLPDRSPAWCDANSVRPNLRPFQFVSDIARQTDGLSLIGTLSSFPVLQVAFNVLLFVPLGVIVRRYFHRSALATIAVGFATSLLIEVTQYTGLWFIYPCAYRVADVDDLLVNTLGTVLGVAIAPAALFWMPDARRLRERRLTPRPVTSPRRWLGMLIDLLLIGTITLAVQACLIVTTSSLGLGTVDNITLPVAFIAAWAVVFLWPAWSGSGASIGQMTVWLTPKWRDGGHWTDGTRARRLAFASVVPAPCALLMLGDAIQPSGLTVLTITMAALAGASVPFTRRRGISGLLTGAEVLDSRASLG